MFSARDVDARLCCVVGAALFFDFLLVTMVIPMMPSLLPRSETRAGVLFAAKPLLQVFFNPLAARGEPVLAWPLWKLGVGKP